VRGREKEERRLLDHGDVLGPERGQAAVLLQRICHPAPVEPVLQGAVPVVEHRSCHALPLRQRWEADHPGVTSFRPTMPPTIRPMQTSLIASVDSEKSTMPSRAVPTVPMPVQMA
jgi:hypothetical protein